VITTTMGGKVSGSTYTVDYVLQADDGKVSDAAQCVVKVHTLRRDELRVATKVISLQGVYDSDVGTVLLSNLPAPSITCTTTDGKNPVYELVGVHKEGEGEKLSATRFQGVFSASFTLFKAK
jgi:hypothetical protein